MKRKKRLRGPTRTVISGAVTEKREVLSVRKFKIGYEVRTERVTMSDLPPVILKSAYTPTGDYIGTPRVASFLIRKYGIHPEKADPLHQVCSIGYSRSRRAWFGWSHRAIAGFRVGSVVKKGSCCADSGWTDEYLKKHPGVEDKSLPVGFKAKTLADARRMAIAFAANVS